MATPPVGTVVLVRFPFSDLSNAKLRPTVVLADVGRGDFILSQITSRNYGDSDALELRDGHFDNGGLRRTSYVRPGKLFTANSALIVREIGNLKPEMCRAIRESIERMLRRGLS